jgi:hypothetical protein
MVGNFFQLHKDLELVEYPLRYSTKTAGAGCVWLKTFGVELVFWMWSCVELSKTRPCSPQAGKTGSSGSLIRVCISKIREKSVL